jgi:predicted transcriptional regulator
MKSCVVGVRRADAPVAEGHGRFASTVWFPSMSTMAAVLSEDNRAMLRLIHERKPKSLTELAELTGRRVPNLSRTLRMMQGYGLVTIEKNARETQPIALGTEFLVVLD